MSVRKFVVLSAAVAMVCALAGSAMAETIAQMEAGGLGSIGLGSEGDPAAIVTAVVYTSASTPSCIISDGTGSCELYTAPAGVAVGDAVSVTNATYAPYNSIPEISTQASTAIVSTGNAVPAINAYTVSQLTAAAEGGDNSVLGYLVAVNGASIGSFTGTSPANFDAHNLTGTITDGSGSMTAYYWESSYNAVKQTPTGTSPGLEGLSTTASPAAMVGLVDLFNPTQPEFIPLWESATTFEAAPYPSR